MSETNKYFLYYIVIQVIILVSDVITMRLEKKDKKMVLELAKRKRESRSNIMRKALLQFIQKETEMDEIKQVVAKKFAEGKISFDDLVRILGFDEAKKVAFYADMAEKSFQEGI